MSNTVLGVWNLSPIRLRQYVCGLAAFWTAAVAVVLVWELLDERGQAIQRARSEALGAWKKEAAVYLWAAGAGRVYMPVTDRTQPDPNLACFGERDVTTESGRKLTRISPPGIMEQVHSISRGLHGFEGHISSLRPIRSEHAPDPWERQALEAFAAGSPEVYSEDKIDENNYLRFMRPLIIEKSCMACHEEQGYKVGDIRGGLSISVPMSSVWGDQWPDVLHRLLGYCTMWLLGLFGIVMMSRHLRHQIAQRDEAEQKLQEANETLEHRVAERTAELAEANRSLESEIVERKQAERWLLESEQRFRGYFEQGLVGMAILTPERDWVEVNGRLCRILGYMEEELLVKTWLDFVDADAWPAVDAEFKRLLGGVVRGFVTDTRLVRKDGQIVPAGLSAQSLQKADGAIDCILVLVQDMTNRKLGSG
jgi:PAS domain S-box-containing protein